jgi:hypothetical protein
MEALINVFCERIAALRGARNLAYLKICLGYCAPCALHFLSQNPFIRGSFGKRVYFAPFFAGLPSILFCDRKKRMKLPLSGQDGDGMYTVIKA